MRRGATHREGNIISFIRFYALLFALMLATISELRFFLVASEELLKWISHIIAIIVVTTTIVAITLLIVAITII